MICMKLYVARHGRTNYNDLRLCNDDPSVDVHLTATGEEQAKALAQRLKKAKIDQVYTSQLRRTQQTAAFVNEFHKAPVRVEARLNDNRTGFEGQPSSIYYAALTQADNMWTVRLNNGESLEDVNQRVRSFIKKLLATKHKTVLIVTSEVIVKTIYGIFKNLPNEEAHAIVVEQGSLLEFDVE
jgi:broad specificity phosphatase PhoE